MLSRLKNHLSKDLTFLENKKLLLAMSGGIDSMVLAHLFKALRYDICIAHCNFGLRGDESDGDENFVRKFAIENDIKVFVTHFDTKAFASDAKLSVQVAARQLRYTWFEELLQNNTLDYLVTAHHQDDAIETFLINFTRGTGLQGLTGIPQQNGNVIRPLLPFSRDDIESYARENNITWREDSSNASDKYLRNKLRHDIVPVLKTLNPSFGTSFAQTLLSLQQAQSLVDDASFMVYKQVVNDLDNQKQINISQLVRLQNYKAYLYQWFSPFGFTAWDDIYNLIDSQSGKYVTAGNFRLSKNRDNLILEPIPEVKDELYKILQNEQKTTNPIGLRLEKVDFFKENSTKNVIFVNNDLIKFPLFVRRWKEGDYFYPSGMNGKKKKVSKYFKDEKFSLSDKENTWLLCTENEIIWVIGHRADDRFKVTGNTTQILKIEVV